MTKVKAPRDPNAPKRNMSAYLIYQNEMRDHFKANNPGITFGQLAKHTSAMYAQLPAYEKQQLQARAEQDKQRYLQELSTYVPPPGYDAKGDAIVVPINQVNKPPAGLPPQMAHVAHGAVASRSKGKVEKDLNAPKRNMSAYLLYQNAMRDQFKRENPGMTFGQLAKYTSHMYRNLTPNEKAAWEYRAQQDKARYDAQIAGYVPPPGHDARGVLIGDPHSAGASRSRKRAKHTPKDPAAPKRASGAYVFFTNEMRPKILQEFPGIKFVDLGRVLGERWRALSPAQKQKFENIASQDKVRFQMEMQRYSGGGGHVAAPPAAQYLPPQQQQRLAAPPPQQQYHHYPDQSLGRYDAYNPDPYAHQQQHHAPQYAAPIPAAAPAPAAKRSRSRKK